MTHVRPVCIIGVMEFRHTYNTSNTEFISSEILEYYGIKKYYRTHALIAGEKQHGNQALNIFSLYENTYEMELLYGIEIDAISIINNCTESIYEKELAEYHMSNFIKFMYEHYSIEFDNQVELMALDINYTDTSNIFSRYIHSFSNRHTNKCTETIMPMDLHTAECNIEIKLVKSEPMKLVNNNWENSSIMHKLSREIGREFCLYIAKAGFKLNVHSIIDPAESIETIGGVGSIDCCRIHFNIYACKKIKPWIHAMKRKIKKKFHIIDKFEYYIKEIRDDTFIEDAFIEDTFEDAFIEDLI